MIDRLKNFKLKAVLIVLAAIGSAFFVSCSSEKIIERAIKKDPAILFGEKEFINSIVPVEIETEERKTILKGVYSPGSTSIVKDEKTGISVAVKIDAKSGIIEAEVIEPKKIHRGNVEVKKVILRPEIKKNESFLDRIAKKLANFGFLVLLIVVLCIFIFFKRIKF
jgi:hypothetical protein